MTRTDSPTPRLKPRASSPQWLVILALCVGGLLIVIPFYWMITTSFKTPEEAYSWPPLWWPTHWDLKNYDELFKTMPFLQMFWNSAWTSVLIATLNIATAAPAAYAFARLRFPNKGLWFGAHLLSMIVPWQITVIPTFLIIRAFGWYDNYLALIVPSISNAFAVFMLYQFFKSLPKSLEESVLIDGGTWFDALRHIALPTSLGALAATWILAFLGNWQAFIWPLIVLQSEDKLVLPVGLLYLKNQFVVKDTLLMAGSTLAVIPTVIAYLFFQRFLTDSGVQSGIKG
jgi:multiple sugar transport system permease protein